MLIELTTQRVGRWYWVTYPTPDGLAARLVITRMDPSNIAVKHVSCTVYGVCECSRLSQYCADARTQVVTVTWVVRKVGFGRGHSNFEHFHLLEDAKAWLLRTVTHRLRQAMLMSPNYASPLSVNYTYEALGCL